MEGVTKGQQRLLGIVGVIVGLGVGFFVFQKVIGNRMIEAPKFVLAVFAGGITGMILYTLIKDGGALVLRRQYEARQRASVVPDAELAVAAEIEPVDAEVAPKAKRTEPLRAAPKPVKAKKAAPRERPLRPRD